MPIQFARTKHAILRADLGLSDVATRASIRLVIRRIAEPRAVAARAQETQEPFARQVRSARRANADALR